MVCSILILFRGLLCIRVLVSRSCWPTLKHDYVQTDFFFNKLFLYFFCISCMRWLKITFSTWNPSIIFLWFTKYFCCSVTQGWKQIAVWPPNFCDSKMKLPEHIFLHILKISLFFKILSSYFINIINIMQTGCLHCICHVEWNRSFFFFFFL